MGFWNPRAICPNCGAKIHTQGQIVFGPLTAETGKTCPNCGVALTGRVGVFSNKAKRAVPQSPMSVGSPKPLPSGGEKLESSDNQPSKMDRLEQLARLRQMDALTEEEFAVKKAELMDEPDLFDVALLEPVAKRVPVIKALREFFPDLELRDAKRLVDRAPAVVVTGVDESLARQIERALNEAGGRAEIQP